jgi:hypothetical protein
MLDFVKHVFAEAVGVSKFGVGFVDAFVDSAAEMFEERTEDIAIER